MRCCVSDAHDAWLIQTGRRKLERCAKVVGSAARPGAPVCPKAPTLLFTPPSFCHPTSSLFTPHLPPNFHTHLGDDLQLARLASQQGLHHLQHKEDGAGKMRRTGGETNKGRPSQCCFHGGPARRPLAATPPPPPPLPPPSHRPAHRARSSGAAPGQGLTIGREHGGNQVRIGEGLDDRGVGGLHTTARSRAKCGAGRKVRKA